jgi:hypothetical protein
MNADKAKLQKVVIAECAENDSRVRGEKRNQRDHRGHGVRTDFLSFDSPLLAGLASGVFTRS